MYYHKYIILIIIIIVVVVVVVVVVSVIMTTIIIAINRFLLTFKLHNDGETMWNNRHQITKFTIQVGSGTGKTTLCVPLVFEKLCPPLLGLLLLESLT